jgi:hypothetical protein
MPRCYDCQNYANLLAKSTGGGVEFSREQFLGWKRSQSRNCHYCNIVEADLYSLNVVNVRTKKIMESIGVDRLDNAKPYTLANIVLCCGPCNAIKSSILTASEMQSLGPQIRTLWNRRLAAPGAAKRKGELAALD